MCRRLNWFTVHLMWVAMLGALPLSAADIHATDWPQWRGPYRDGSVGDVTRLPESLGGLELIWRTELAPSYSGPIVNKNVVFVTETQGKKTERVQALDRRTGDSVWTQQWAGAMSVPFFAKANGDWIRATPAYDGERLYVAGMRDLLVCLDATSGSEVWRIDFVKQLGTSLPSFGCVSSPLVLGDHVYVQAGNGFCKIDKRSGEILFRVLREKGGMSGGAFSSPGYDELSGVPQLIVQTRSSMAGVQPSDGTVLWEQDIDAFRGMNILTPTVYNDSVFTSSYGGRSLLLSTAVTETGIKTNEAWRNKAQGYMSTPVIVEGHAYMQLRNQRATCLDLKTGKTCWTTTPFGKYWSLITDGDRILALDEKGELILMRVNPQEFELLDRRQVGEDCWAHLAVSGNEIFVRELNGLSVYRW